MEEERFQDLPAWRAAQDFVLDVYRVTEGWPMDGPHGLAAEIRSAAVTVPAKISNGHGRGEPVGMAEQLLIARRSLREVEVRLMIGRDLGLGDPAAIGALAADAEEVRRLIDDLLALLPEPAVTVDPFNSPFGEN